MPARLRYSVSSLLAVLAAALAAACGSNVSSGGSSSNTGGGSSICTGLCDLLVQCGPMGQCTFADDGAATAACASACESGLGAIPSSEADAVTACYTCAVHAAQGSCTTFLAMTQGTCQSACTSAAFTKANDDWGKAVGTAAMGNSALTCTDGQNPFAGETCTGGTVGTSGCVFSCCNGDTCPATPPVQITCTGSTDGQLTCTCTEGKDKGKVLPATTCDTAGSLDPWSACNG
jgi:hypothetical protein